MTRVLGEVPLFGKDLAAVDILKLRASSYGVLMFAEWCREHPHAEFYTLMIWRDYPVTTESWALRAFGEDVDDVILGPHDDGRREDSTYTGVVQRAAVVADDFVPAFAGDFGETS
jgi:hypothetical protein